MGTSTELFAVRVTLGGPFTGQTWDYWHQTPFSGYPPVVMPRRDLTQDWWRRCLMSLQEASEIASRYTSAENLAAKVISVKRRRVKQVPANSQRFTSPRDFTIGQVFYTATGAWVCRDVGTRIITASLIEWGLGGSDLGSEVIFDEYDFGGCFSKDPKTGVVE